MILKLTKGLFIIILWTLLSIINHNDTYAQGHRVKEVSRLYDSLISHKIAFPKTVLAIVIYETGWMQCKSCALEHNNLFGFRTNKDFIKFTSVTESIKYLKKWQNRYYTPWKTKHAEGTYYEYLTYIRYCDHMDNYIKEIKSIEKWLSQNIAMATK
jgi:hypothetical protein